MTATPTSLKTLVARLREHPRVWCEHWHRPASGPVDFVREGEGALHFVYPADGRRATIPLRVGPLETGFEFDPQGVRVTIHGASVRLEYPPF